MANDIAISLDNISLSLPGPEGEVSILQHISLTVKPGESLGVMGASGSGKTSLLMVIAGVERASNGKVIIAGQDITHFSEDEMAAFRQRHIGVVFQNFHLIPTMTALENTALGLEFAGHKDAIKQAERALEVIGLGARLHHYPSQLSGGEQQRVALARATVMKPSILLADEPTGNLDSETGRQIMDLLFNLQKEHGTTLLLITHDEALAARASRHLLMQDGRLKEAVDA